MADVQDTSGQTGKFYVYVLYRPDGRPFYVGKGSGRRVHLHDWNARSGKVSAQPQLYRTIAKIRKNGGEFCAEIVFRSDSEEVAFSEEKRLVALYGRNSLCNLTNGGEGVSGMVWADERRKAWSEKLKGNQHLLGHKMSEESKKKISIGNRGQKRSDEARANMRRAQANKPPMSPESRAKVSASKRGVPWPSPRDAEYIKRLRAAIVGKPKSEEHKEKLRQANLGKKCSDETKAKVGEASRQHWADPEYRAKMMAIRNSAEYREKQRIAQKARRDRESATMPLDE